MANVRPQLIDSFVSLVLATEDTLPAVLTTECLRERLRDSVANAIELALRGPVTASSENPFCPSAPAEQTSCRYLPK